MSRIRFSKLLLALPALVIFTGTLQAVTTISFSPAPTANTITLTCDVVSGANPVVNVPVIASAAATAVSASVTTGQGVVALQSDDKTLLTTSQSVGLSAVNFGFRLGAGCRGATSGSSVTITFTATSVSPISVTANIVLANTTSTALTASASSVTLACTKGGSAGSPVAINVTSAALGGTNFYVDQTTALPPWVQVSNTATSGAPNQANPGPIVLTLTPQACTSLALGTYPTAGPYQLTLANPPGAPLKIPVTMVVANGNPLTQIAPVTLTYVKPTTYGQSNQNLVASSAGPVFYQIDMNTVPGWLTVTPTSNTIAASGTQVLDFQSVAGAATLPLGSYTANVHIKVANAVDMVVTVYLQVQNASTALGVVEAHDQSAQWTLGTPYPTFTLTPIATDSPVGYSVSIVGDSGNNLPVSWNPTKGMAYNFGSPISITFPAGTFASSSPGDHPKWDVTLTNLTTNTAIPSCCSVSVNVQSPGARISSAMPSALSTAPAGTTLNLTLNGSGFVTAAPPQQTVVGVVPQNGQFIVLDAGTITNVSVVSSTTISLTLTVPTNPDPYFPFAAGGPVTLGVCNPNGTTCSTPGTGGTLTLQIGGGPIIQAVTSASSFIQAAAPALTPLAPFDIISLFGQDFCISGGTGCTISNPTNPILYGQTTTTGPLQYLTSLSPDGGTRALTVAFQTHTTPPTPIGMAPLLFATNSQINAIVPEAVNAYVGKVVDIVVSFGPVATSVKSAVYPVLIANVDPGIFTVGSGGNGAAAALDKFGNLVSATNPVSVNLASDYISLYVTGLGEPDSTKASPAWSTTTCMADADYVNLANGSTSPNGNVLIDGLVFQTLLFPTSPASVQPCLMSTDTAGLTSNLPTVTIGGLPGTVTYAGFVPDSVAGLYQINVTLPTGTAAFTAGTPYTTNFTDPNGSVLDTLIGGTTLPVYITSRTIPSQLVTLNVKAQLDVVPTLTAGGTSVTAAHGSFSNLQSIATFAVTGGSGTYHFAAPSLPAGFSIDASSGAITVPTAASVTASGTHTVTITVTDPSPGTTFTGTATITFNIT
jgi:uncharacterized protein (TIGR03437 family)